MSDMEVCELRGGRVRNSEYMPNCSPQFAVYVVAVLEYMSTDIWKLVTGYVRHARQTEITSSDVKIALQTGKKAETVIFLSNPRHLRFP